MDLETLMRQQNLQDTILQKQKDKELEKALRSRLPQLLGIPIDENGILTVEGTPYKVLQSYDQSPGHMLAIEASSADDPVGTPTILFVPEVKQAIEDLERDPMAFAQKIATLADDETLPQDLRQQLGAMKQIFSMLE